jgi:hypothetical protein
MFHLRPGGRDPRLVASNAFHDFFKLAADLRLRVTGLLSNRDLQISKLFVDVDELETNVSTERIYKRTHGEPLAGMHPTPPALLCRVEIETSEARQICENSCKATGQAADMRFGLLMQDRDCRCAWRTRTSVKPRLGVLLRSLV